MKKYLKIVMNNIYWEKNMDNTKWVFRELEGAGFEGPNSGSGDHFKGTKLSSLVRELVQNSMDQITKKSDKVKIMDLKKVSAKNFNGFYGIWPHVEASFISKNTQ